MTTKNLWGEIKDLHIVKSPVAILNEQAQLLEQLTDGLLVGRTARISNDPNQFMFDFSINAPSLNNYSYNVLRIFHDITLYPVAITQLKAGASVRCGDVNEFESELGKIFSSPEIQRVIAGLLSQIQTTKL